MNSYSSVRIRIKYRIKHKKERKLNISKILYKYPWHGLFESLYFYYNILVTITL